MSPEIVHVPRFLQAVPQKGGASAAQILRQRAQGRRIPQVWCAKQSPSIGQHQRHCGPDKEQFGLGNGDEKIENKELNKYLNKPKLRDWLYFIVEIKNKLFTGTPSQTYECVCAS